MRIPDSAGHNGHDLFLHLSLLMRFFFQPLFFQYYWYWPKEIDPQPVLWGIKTRYQAAETSRIYRTGYQRILKAMEKDSQNSDKNKLLPMFIGVIWKA